MTHMVLVYYFRIDLAHLLTSNWFQEIKKLAFPNQTHVTLKHMALIPNKFQQKSINSERRVKLLFSSAFGVDNDR